MTAGDLLKSGEGTLSAEAKGKPMASALERQNHEIIANVAVSGAGGGNPRHSAPAKPKICEMYQHHVKHQIIALSPIK